MPMRGSEIKTSRSLFLRKHLFAVTKTMLVYGDDPCPSTVSIQLRLSRHDWARPGQIRASHSVTLTLALSQTVALSHTQVTAAQPPKLHVDLVYTLHSFLKCPVSLGLMEYLTLLGLRSSLVLYVHANKCHVINIDGRGILCSAVTQAIA